MRRLVIPIIALVVAACSDDTVVGIRTTAPPLAVVSPLFGTLNSNIREPRRLLIRDQQSWAVLWSEVVGTAATIPAPPFVDFLLEDVLVVAIGERRVAGFSVEITDVVLTGSALRVDFVTTNPAPGCNGSEVITTPLDAVRIPKSNLPIVFNERIAVINCGT